MRRDGVTIVEILVVIAIIGLLAGIFGWSLISGIRKAQLREAANQVASDFRRARSQAQRGSADMVIEWTLDANGKITAYSLAGQSRPVANGAVLSCITGCSSGNNKVTYTAPYGELDATGNVFSLTSPMTSLPTMQVRIVGVTGKVIVAGGS
ncbi:prepilin-type N-terminal cleavage/methylation domain-containing protein [Deinococcus cavernae]|uniref:Prepilin-type N-terminal cleavage/methylation domain-containing protein n=1 Tax=Deinococcus cavernae TaxID=2320857 RepID=A0A418V9K9_9DEIO|nr:prepilin-type N-terminal cleavage/methylation domain-containing protein [Deinococcus cavernae]RJF72801.1 prepilin-type N-terminal cleavage/methylation domain-containing protein [Deinococcus cavernae]